MMDDLPIGEGVYLGTCGLTHYVGNKPCSNKWNEGDDVPRNTSDYYITYVSVFFFFERVLTYGVRS